jgi:hypothetical protein
MSDEEIRILAETANYAVVVGHDEEGEPVYSIELGTVTVHLYQDEWDELIELIHSANQ